MDSREGLIALRGAAGVHDQARLCQGGADAGLEDVTPHVLRHTAASRMAEAGVPMGQIAAVLGHSDEHTTARIYARFSPGFLRSAVDALDTSEE